MNRQKNQKQKYEENGKIETRICRKKEKKNRNRKKMEN